MADQVCVSRYFEYTTTLPINPNSVQSIEEFYPSQNHSQTTTEHPEILLISQVTINEHEPIDIQPFYNITPREMPLSPHYIFEEEFSANPWAMLIATIFLTKTAGRIARPHMKGFFQQYPTPYHVLEVNPACLVKFFEKIGLRKRAHMIWKLTYQFVSGRWRRASDLCGIGKYGEDAYRIFCLAHTDLDPGDRYLKLYLDWLQHHTVFLTEKGVMDSECFIKDPVLNYYRITLRN